MSRRQRLAFHRPSERLRHRGIEVADEAFDPLLEMLLGREVAAAEEFAGHRQLGCRPACEMRLSRVGGRDDDIYLSELCRLPLPG